jgi:tRNA threonylcarbamoyladenosine biosynthesis protein TsaB
MRLLAIETSTEACSAALSIAGETVELYELAPQRHTELILPMIDRLLAEADLPVHALQGLAFGRGPGAFTGVRVATGVVQGIALGTGLLVAPISSLAALAQGAYLRTGQTHVLAAIDAHMGEVYWGAYAADADGLMRELDGETVCTPAVVPLPRVEASWFGVGTGWMAHAEALKNRFGSRGIIMDEAPRYPRAREVARLGVDAFKHGRVVPAERALPIYLRDRVAVPSL